MAFTLRIITQMLDELQQQPALQKLADSLSDLLREINEEFEKNKESLTEKFENLVEDQLSGIEFYANMPDWQIELIDSFDIDTSDLKNDTEEKMTNTMNENFKSQICWKDSTDLIAHALNALDAGEKETFDG